MRKIKQIILASILGLTLANPITVLAQTTSSTINVPEYKNVDTSITQFLCTPSPAKDGQDLVQCINKVYRFGISFGAIALVFFLVFAGYMYITGGETGKAKAKGILQNALIGIALLLGSYVLLRFINPNLVIIKPIQPPIFTAADLPACEDVGLGEDCVLEGGGTSTGTGDGDWGTRITCPSNKIVSAKGLGLPTKSGDEQICEDFGKKLLGLKSQLSGLSWRITDTIGPGHLSKCHKTGDAQAGSCADIGYEPKDRSTENWNKLCKALISIGQLQPVNEADSAASDCPKYGTYSTTTGNHIHVNWKSGGGGGTNIGSAGTVNSNCIADSRVPGLCANPLSGDKNWPPGDWSNTDPALKTAYNQWEKLYGKSIPLNQIYRSPAYAAHLRSIWEASQFKLKTSYGNDNSVKTFDPAGTCAGRASSFVTKAIYDKWSSTQLGIVQSEMSNHGFSGPTTSTTCSSDHDKGIGLDVLKTWGPLSSDIKKLEQTAVSAGLCHNVKNDLPHFALKSKVGSANCYWAGGK